MSWFVMPNGIQIYQTPLVNENDNIKLKSKQKLKLNKTY